MTQKYTTVEGHPIVVGERYETCGGAIATIHYIASDEDVTYPILGFIPEGLGSTQPKESSYSWTKEGKHIRGSKCSDYDLMRPAIVKPQPPTKTLRDEFAMTAMVAAWNGFDKGYYDGGNIEIARCAYQIADAMLKARGE